MSLKKSAVGAALKVLRSLEKRLERAEVVVSELENRVERYREFVELLQQEDDDA